MISPASEAGATYLLPKGTEYVITAKESGSYATITVAGNGFAESTYGVRIYIPFPTSADGKIAKLTCDTTVVVKQGNMGLYWTVAPVEAQ